MGKSKDNLEFAERLKQAISRSRQKIDGPTQLANAFNLIYNGMPITNQAAQKWLVGDNKPSPDKIIILSQMLNVPMRWLQHGIPETKPTRISSSSPRQIYGSDTPSPAEQAFLSRYRLLSPYQQHLVSGLTEQLALEREIWADSDSVLQTSED